MAYWLVITYCVATASGDDCSLRLVDEAWDSPLQCRIAGQVLAAVAPGYRWPFTCSNTRPDGTPLAPAPVAPGRWA